MNPVSKHYYRAVVWYYLGNDLGRALDEIYQALEIRNDHSGAIALAKRIGKRGKCSPGLSKQNSEVEDVLSLLEVESRDRFFSSFLSYEIDAAIGQIDWQGWSEILAKSSRLTDYIWYLILQQNWEKAVEFWRDKAQELHGNVVAYFQTGYLLQKAGEFNQAEAYLQALLPFRGVYRVVGIRMLLRLPKHQFATLADISSAFAEATPKEMLAIAKILQNSWDSKAFNVALSNLEKRISMAEDYIDLALIYANEGDFKHAVNCLYRAYECRRDCPQIILATLRLLPMLSDRNVRRFVEWLTKKLSMEHLWELLEIVRPFSPDIALKSYQMLYKKSGQSGKSLLGQAVAFLYQNDEQKSWLLLEQAATADPELLPEITVWQAQILHRQHKTQLALDMLQKRLEQFQRHPMLLAAMREITENSCPVCYSHRDSLLCPQCGYRSPGIFAWEQGKLRWNGQRLYFPTATLLLTTDSQWYTSQESIHIIIFSSYSGEGQLSLMAGANTVRRKKIGITHGLVLLREENLPPGIYQIILETPVIRANRHFFLVGEPCPDLKLEVIEVSHVENTIVIRLHIFDIAGFSFSGPITIHAFTPFYPWRQQEQFSIDNGIISLKWQLRQWRGMMVISAHAGDGKKGTTIISPYRILDKEQTRELFTQYQKSLRKHLPLSLEQVTGESIALQFRQAQREVVAALQPIGDGPIQVHRLSDVAAEKTHLLPVIASLAGFYLGTTRFYPGHLYQCVGWEMCGIALNNALGISIHGPSRVMPGENFFLTIETTKPARAIAISRPVLSCYHPLSAHFLQSVGDILTNIGIPEQPQNSSVHDAFDRNYLVDKRWDCSEFQLFDIENTTTIPIKSLQEHGKQEIICIASDGDFFAERRWEVEVYSSCCVHAPFMTAIGSGDSIEKDIFYYSENSARLQVISSVRGTIHEQTVQSHGQTRILINSPDTIEIALGEIRRKYELPALEMTPVTYNKLYCLTAQDSWPEPNTTVYASSMALAQDIVITLFDDPHADAETLAAKLYCAARMYQICVAKNAPTQNWTNHISKWGRELYSQSQFFSEGRWGYAASFAPEKAMTEEILHHLSPFLEMPRFGDVHNIAKKTLAAALQWKITNNRLFPLSLMFQERSCKTPQAAAGALQYDFETSRALKYLQRSATDKNRPHWHGNSPGGEEQTTALVALAYLSQNYPVKNILAYFQDRLQNMLLSSPAATVAFIDLLLALEESPAQIISEQGETISLQDKMEISEPFVVERGLIWCRRDQMSIENLPAQFVPASIKVRWQGTSPLQVGAAFTLEITPRLVDHPHLQLLIPSNMLVIKDRHMFQGHMIWPEPGKKIKIFCQALCPGLAHFYILLRDRYNFKRKFVTRYPIAIAEQCK